MAEERQAPTTLLSRKAERATVGTLPSYFHVLWRSLKGSTPFAIYERLRILFRPTIWVARVLRILRIILLVVETSALLLLATAFLLLLLPFAIIFFLSLWLATEREKRRAGRRLTPLLVGRCVVVCFGREEGLPLSLAEDYTVLVVGDDLPGRNPAVVAAAGKGGIILIRMHYFFYLRRTLLRRSARVCLLF